VSSFVTGQSRGVRLLGMDTRLHAHNALYILSRPHAGCAGRADNVTGMLGVDLGSQSVVGRVNAVTDLSGKDVSARRGRSCLVFAAGGSGPLLAPHASPLTRRRPTRAARRSSRPRSRCARRRPRCWTSARRCGAREWPCHPCRSAVHALQVSNSGSGADLRWPGRRHTFNEESHLGNSTWVRFPALVCSHSAMQANGCQGPFMHTAPAEQRTGCWTCSVCVSRLRNTVRDAFRFWVCSRR